MKPFLQIPSVVALNLWVCFICTAAEPPKFQYESKGIAIPAATADEPRVTEFGPASIRAAAKYLDDGAVCEVRKHSCVACHSEGVYLAERPVLTPLLGPPSAEVHAAFVKGASKDGSKIHGNYVYEVWRASGLAAWDKHVEEKLSATTDRQLQSLVRVLNADGHLAALHYTEIPHFTTSFELTMQAARALAIAPGWLANLQDADLLARVERLKKYLREHPPVSDYELALKLQLATLLPELVPPDVRAAAVAMLWRQQQPDGGWATRRMADVMQWHHKPNRASSRSSRRYPTPPTPRATPT